MSFIFQPQLPPQSEPCGSKLWEDVLKTPALIPQQDGLVLFCMMGTATLHRGLLAIKSLWAQLQRGRVAILDDGTLTGRDRALLALHCGDPEILDLAGVDGAGFPQNHIWARLLSVLDHRHGEYWVQLDGNIIITGPVPEVEAAILSNRSFILPAHGCTAHAPAPLGKVARASDSDAPPPAGTARTTLEACLHQIGHDMGWRYIAGCSAFAGFAAGGAGRPLAAAFLAEMTQFADHDALASNAAEQVLSGFLIANDPAPVILPAERYCHYQGSALPENTALVHFPEADSTQAGQPKAETAAMQEKLSRLIIARLSAMRGQMQAKDRDEGRNYDGQSL